MNILFCRPVSVRLSVYQSMSLLIFIVRLSYEITLLSVFLIFVIPLRSVFFKESIFSKYLYVFQSFRLLIADGNT
jgi:hypothetical protein